MGTEIQKLQRQNKLYIPAVITGLALSRITAFPLETEIGSLSAHSTQFPETLRNLKQFT